MKSFSHDLASMAAAWLATFALIAVASAPAASAVAVAAV